VTQNIFLGSKQNDYKVPTNAVKTDLMERKKAQMAAEQASSMYTTTNNVFLETTAQELKTIYGSGGYIGRCTSLLQGARFFMFCFLVGWH
jgi:hypothetical protein